MKKWKKIVSVLALGSALAISGMAEAYDSWSAVMNARATAYTDSNLTKRNGVEYADKGDAVTVLDESPKAYLVRYPLSKGGYKERWVARTAVTGVSSSIANAASTAVKNAVTAAQNNYQQWQGVANCRATAYTNSALSQRNGVEYVDKGDTVTVLNEAGNAYYVRYPLARGGTKDRWVSKNAIDKPARGADALAQASSQAQSTANQAQSVQRTYASWPAVMNRRATAYTDENLTKRNGVEYADKGDAVTVLNESAKGYLVKYPLSKGGYKERWVARSAVTATGSTNANTNTGIASGAVQGALAAINTSSSAYQEWQGQATRKVTAYKDSALKIRQGVEYVSAGDVVTVLGESDKSYYVRYPLSRGGTKDRWVDKSAIQNVNSNSSTGKVDYIQSQYQWPIEGNYQINTLYYYLNYRSSRTGYKHSCRYSHFNGLDIQAAIGRPIKAVQDGKVITSTNAGSGFGNYIEIEHPDGTKSLYAHLSQRSVKVNDSVKKGQEIGKSGNSGGVSAHFHFEFSNKNAWEVYRSIVPFKYCKTTKTAYDKRCSQEDKAKFKEAIDWIEAYGGGFTA